MLVGTLAKSVTVVQKVVDMSSLLYRTFVI